MSDLPYYEKEEKEGDEKKGKGIKVKADNTDEILRYLNSIKT